MHRLTSSSEGPFVASFLIKKTGSVVAVFYMGIVINALFGLYVTFFMPESVDLDHPPTSSCKVPNSKCGSDNSLWKKINIFSTLSILFRSNSTRISRYALPILAVIQFISAFIALPPVLLYAMLKFRWTAYEGGLFVSIAALSRLGIMMIVLPLLAKLFLKKSGDSENDSRHMVSFDTLLLRTGVAINAFCLLTIGLATSSNTFTLGFVIQSLAILAQPAIQSLIVATVDPSEVGELMSAVAVMDSVAVICGQFGLNAIYSATVATVPSLVFFLCGGAALTSLFLALFVHPVSRRTSEEEDLLGNSDIYAI
ncbi:hypothetical protein DFQ30_008702 [Apophysomyces sp. BC1015]|nr:hypothetical protein DFQ30_008702 [Apophysomyces sp. BC1015]